MAETKTDPVENFQNEMAGVFDNDTMFEKGKPVGTFFPYEDFMRRHTKELAKLRKELTNAKGTIKGFDPESKNKGALYKSIYATMKKVVDHLGYKDNRRIINRYGAFSSQGIYCPVVVSAIVLRALYSCIPHELHGYDGLQKTVATMFDEVMERYDMNHADEAIRLCILHRYRSVAHKYTGKESYEKAKKVLIAELHTMKLEAAGMHNGIDEWVKPRMRKLFP